MMLSQMGTWLYAHLSQVGVGLLALNTVFQKLPLAQQNDLISLAGKGLKWIWQGIASKLTPAQQAGLSEDVKALIAAAVREEMAKGIGK
ncbi:MAG: hypothetical protein ACP5SH_18200 [Syntrophobacteraceae bacterium]